MAIVSGGSTRTIARVTFGDVYICAGDGDMSRTVGSLPSADAILSDAAKNFTTIRLYGGSSAGWGSAAVGQNLSQFSALCFLSGRAMQSLYNPTGAIGPVNVTTPVGLIAAAALGDPPDALGSRLTDWAPDQTSVRRACAGMMMIQSQPSPYGVQGIGGAFDKYLAPLQQLALRGLFWTMGNVDAAKATTDTAAAYALCFEAAVESWRDGGQIGDWSVSLAQGAGGAYMRTSHQQQHAAAMYIY
jgi:hypothetical protein